MKVEPTKIGKVALIAMLSAGGIIIIYSLVKCIFKINPLLPYEKPMLYTVLGIAALCGLMVLAVIIHQSIQAYKQALEKYYNDVSDEDILEYCNTAFNSAIIELYGDYIILAQDDKDLKTKKRNIDRGDTVGFMYKERIKNAIINDRKS